MAVCSLYLFTPTALPGMWAPRGQEWCVFCSGTQCLAYDGHPGTAEWMNKSTAAHLPLTSHSVQTSNDTVLSLLWEKQGVSPFPSMYVFLEHHIEGRERSQWFCFYCQSFGHSTRYLRQLTVMENAPSLWFHNCEQMLTTRQATGNQGRALFASAGRDPFSPASS